MRINNYRYFKQKTSNGLLEIHEDEINRVNFDNNDEITFNEYNDICADQYFNIFLEYLSEMNMPKIKEYISTHWANLNIFQKINVLKEISTLLSDNIVMYNLNTQMFINNTFIDFLKDFIRILMHT